MSTTPTTNTGPDAGKNRAPRTRDRSREGHGKRAGQGGPSPPPDAGVRPSAGPAKPATRAKAAAPAPAAPADGRPFVPIAAPGADRRPEVDVSRPLRRLTPARAGSDPGALVGMTDRDAEPVREPAVRTGDTDLARLVKGAAAYGYAVLIRTDLPPIE